MSEPDSLTERLATLVGDRHPVAAVAVVDRDGVRTAWRACEQDADFEIGSVTKGVTGLLYAEALAGGEVAASTRLGELLPLGGSPAGSVTLQALSTHRSGLPRLPPGQHPTLRTLELWTRGRNPYRQSRDELVEGLRTVTLGRPRPRYSNLGYAVLGHALAAAAGTSYADLVQQRIAGPFGLDAFYATYSPDDLRAGSLVGRNRLGCRCEPWANEGIAPAGTIRSSIGDLGRLVAALVDGSAPGIRALDPVERFGGRALRIGAAWLVLTYRGREVTWHNGGTGGFRSWVGLDRAAGTGVAVLTATMRSVDRIGFALLTDRGR
jgi:CubicO group peptidase (beta-lactamase class C family)